MVLEAIKDPVHKALFVGHFGAVGIILNPPGNPRDLFRSESPRRPARTTVSPAGTRPPGPSSSPP